tara:strand:+ start:237 stop:1274 length:1038 start_codon:yes stop_codon:yes gene_type:complete
MTNEKVKKYKISNPSSNRFLKITEDLYWARIPLPFRLDHVNVFAIKSIDGLVLIDTGINNEETKRSWDSILENLPTNHEISKIIISHHHPDHIGMSKYLSEKLKVNVYAPKKELSRAKKIINLSDDEYGYLLSKSYKEFGFSENIIIKSKNRGNFYKGMIKELPKINDLQENFTIVTKEGSWCARFDTGHSPSQLSLFDKERKLYLCFDFLLPRISPNISVGIEDNEFNILEEYYKYLNSISNDYSSDWIVIPGHEFPYYDPVKRANNLIIHHNSRLDLILSEIKNTELTILDAMEILFDKVNNSHDIFFASCETKAHINYLLSANKIILDKSKNVFKYLNNYRN